MIKNLNETFRKISFSPRENVGRVTIEIALLLSSHVFVIARNFILTAR